MEPSKNGGGKLITPLRNNEKRAEGNLTWGVSVAKALAGGITAVRPGREKEPSQPFTQHGFYRQCPEKLLVEFGRAGRRQREVKERGGYGAV